jgi:PhnB protein
LSSLLAVELALSAWGPLAGTLGFSKRRIMNRPDGKPIHAELTLRGTTLMLAPENSALGKCITETVGASPARLFLYVENVEKIVAKAVSLGVTAQGQVMDMFWGDSSRRSSRPRGIRADGGHAQG